MNIVLDVLRLRRVKLDYVSPPICPVVMSGSGSSIMVEIVGAPEPPTALMFSGQCNRFLTWTSPAGTICTSLYRANNPNDILTTYTLISECVPNGSVSVCSPGWWKYSTSTADGVESDLSQPIYSPGGSPIVFPIDQIAGAVRVNLYKNPNPLNPVGSYPLVLSTTSMSVIEVCDLTGCYRLQVISDEGPSELSQTICRTEPSNCCPSPGCPSSYRWDSVLCSCVPGGLTGIAGPLANSCMGAAYSSELTAIGGDEPFTWTLLSGVLPDGLTLHTGVFSGLTAPITGTATGAGDFTFTAQVEDSNGTIVSGPFTIHILGITQGSVLPNGTTDTPYSVQLAGAGGIAPYLFSLDGGSFPSGLSMDSAGLITGTATDLDTESVTIGILDATGNKCELPLSISIVGCPSVSSYPTIDWTSGIANPWPTMEILDTKRRNVLIQLSNASGPGNLLLDAISSITKTYIAEYPDDGSGNMFGTSWMGYDPVNDLVIIASRTTNWTRFNPATGLYSTAGAQAIQIGQDNFFRRLAVDIKRGHVMGTSQGTKKFQVVRITPSTSTSLIVSADQWALLRHCCYNEVSDKYVLLGSVSSPAISYVDPVSFAVTVSTLAIQSGGPAQNLVLSLPGTPWIVFNDSTSHLAFVDTTNDTLYWSPTEAVSPSSIQDFSYNSCSGVFTVAMDSFIKQFDVLNKSYVGTIPAPGGLGGYYSMIFDPTANLTYCLVGQSPADPTPRHIITI